LLKSPPKNCAETIPTGQPMICRETILAISFDGAQPERLALRTGTAGPVRAPATTLDAIAAVTLVWSNTGMDRVWMEN
jgi:hypothetical protein